jgi:putative ABC transport system permease protein
VQDRVKEHAVLQTLGFRTHLIARLIVAESLLVSLLGGVVGSVLALVFLKWGRFSWSVDGVNIAIATGVSSLLIGLLCSVVLGVTAGLLPAWQASRRTIVECFRMT